MKRSRLLIIGPSSASGFYGGATVLMDNFIDWLDTNNISYYFAITNKYWNVKTEKPLKLLNFLVFLFHFVLKLPFCDRVMFNMSDNSFANIFPYFCFVVKIFGKKVIVRKFGPSFERYYPQMSVSRQKMCLKALYKADLIFQETKEGIVYLQNILGKTNNIVWFPNVRKPQIKRKDASIYKKRLCFISHILKTKGIGEIIEMADKLPSDYTIDLYGGCRNGEYKNFDFKSHNIQYHGEINKECVIKELLSHDILLLPSYTEGYPGIVLEAMSVGVPSIASNVGGIPEIIENGVNGILIEPRNVNSLINAVLSITDDSYRNMCDSAYNSFKQYYDCNIVNRKVYETIMSL